MCSTCGQAGSSNRSGFWDRGDNKKKVSDKILSNFLNYIIKWTRACRIAKIHSEQFLTSSSARSKSLPTEANSPEVVAESTSLRTCSILSAVGIACTRQAEKQFIQYLGYRNLCLLVHRSWYWYGRDRSGYSLCRLLTLLDCNRLHTLSVYLGYLLTFI